MVLGIDARLINGKRRGMGNVLYNILKTLKNYLSDIDIILYFDKKLDDELLIELKELGYEIYVIENTNYFYWEQVLLPRYVKYVDLFWFPYNTATVFFKTKYIVTIHDVMFLKPAKVLPYSRNLHQIAGRLYRKIIVPIIAKRAKRIITISEHAKKDIANEIRNVEHKIEVIYNGCDKKIDKKLDCKKWDYFKNKYNIPRDYLFCLGAVDPRKNTLYTIEVFAEFIKKYKLRELKLVVCGIENWSDSVYYKYVKDLNLESRIIFLEYVSDEIIDMLYYNAKIFLFLSYYEGFGLPILESMALGTPVITTNVTSMPEVAGQAAIITSHNIVGKTVEDIAKLYFDKDLYNDLIIRGINRAKEFSWDITTKKVSELIRKEIDSK